MHAANLLIIVYVQYVHTSICTFFILVSHPVMRKGIDSLSDNGGGKRSNNKYSSAEVKVGVGVTAAAAAGVVLVALSIVAICFRQR